MKTNSRRAPRAKTQSPAPELVKPREPFPEAEYRAALRKERENRDWAFVDIDREICGVAVRQMSLRQMMVRVWVGCPFLNGGTPEPEDIASFLWYLSPRFTTCAEDRETFTREIALSVRYDEAVKEIKEYLEITFADSPPQSCDNKPKAPKTSIVATLVDIFAAEYGWSEEYVLDRPLARLYQLLREIQTRKNPKALLFNKFSDRVKMDWARKNLNQKPAAPAAEAKSP